MSRFLRYTDLVGVNTLWEVKLVSQSVGLCHYSDINNWLSKEFLTVSKIAVNDHVGRVT